MSLWMNVLKFKSVDFNAWLMLNDSFKRLFPLILAYLFELFRCVIYFDIKCISSMFEIKLCQDHLKTHSSTSTSIPLVRYGGTVYSILYSLDNKGIIQAVNHMAAVQCTKS